MDLYETLKAAYEKHNRIIIAVDLDDTVRPYLKPAEECESQNQLGEQKELLIRISLSILRTKTRSIMLNG